MPTVYEEINLRKEKVIDLTKKRGITRKSQVVVALDYSGSMSSLYSNGEVQKLVERLLPLGMAMDDNEIIDFYLFENGVTKIESVTLGNIKDFVNKKIIGKYNMGGTNYAPVINRIVADFGGAIENHSKEQILEKKRSWLETIKGIGKSAVNTVTAAVTGHPITPKTFDDPVLVLFITDGENGDKADAEKAIINASYYGIFFQFIGIGHESFSFLKKLDTMEGRLIDNANFFKEPDLSKTSDDDLYSLILTEYPSYLPLAQNHQLIK